MNYRCLGYQSNGIIPLSHLPLSFHNLIYHQRVSFSAENGKIQQYYFLLSTPLLLTTLITHHNNPSNSANLRKRGRHWR